MLAFILTYDEVYGDLQGPKLVKQDKYTMDPGKSSLSQHKEKIFWSKMIFEQKQIRKMHKSCMIND